MSELIRREDLENWLRTECASIDTYEDKEYVIGRLREDLPTVNSWHMVEEPPKEVGCYLVVGFDRYWFYDIAEYFPIDNEWVMNENQSDSTYIRYWMPLPEPPKED